MQFIKYLVLLVFIVSCNNQKKKEVLKTNVKTLIGDAKGFDIQEFDNYTKLQIKTPYPDSKQVFEYILVSKNATDLPSFSPTAIVIKTPIKKMVVTSTTHIPMLELLGVENTLVGFPNMQYISSIKTRALIENGKIQELGMDAQLNTEITIDLEPDAIVGFAINANNKSFNTIKRSGIPVIYCGAWLEETPMGRAEWLKLFGVLYEKTALADSLFSAIKSEYNQVKSIAAKQLVQSSVLSGSLFKDVWNLPAGESFVAQFLKDANTDYLWKNTKGKGSLHLNFENVLDKAQNADLWIAPGSFDSKTDLLNANPHYVHFKAYKTSNIYTFSKKKGTTGGLIYFELGATRPDLILKDIIKIAHPKLLPNYEMTFFDKMESEMQTK